MAELPQISSLEHDLQIEDFEEIPSSDIHFLQTSTFGLPAGFYKRERIDSEEIIVTNLKSKRKLSEITNFEIYRTTINQNFENCFSAQKGDNFEIKLTEFAVFLKELYFSIDRTKNSKREINQNP